MFKWTRNEGLLVNEGNTARTRKCFCADQIDNYFVNRLTGSSCTVAEVSDESEAANPKGRALDARRAHLTLELQFVAVLWAQLRIVSELAAITKEVASLVLIALTGAIVEVTVTAAVRTERGKIAATCIGAARALTSHESAIHSTTLEYHCCRLELAASMCT